MERSDECVIEEVKQLNYMADPLRWLEESLVAYRMQGWEMFKGNAVWVAILVSVQMGSFWVFARAVEASRQVMPVIAEPELIASFASFAASVLVMTAMVVSAVKVALRFVRGEASSWRDTFTLVDMNTFGRVFCVVAPEVVLLHVTSSFLVIPALLLAPFFFFAVPLVVENSHLSPTSAIRASAIAVRKEYLPMLAGTLGMNMLLMITCWATLGLGCCPIVFPVVMASTVFGYWEVFGIRGALASPADAVLALQCEKLPCGADGERHCTPSDVEQGGGPGSAPIFAPSSRESPPMPHHHQLHPEPQSQSLPQEPAHQSHVPSQLQPPQRPSVAIEVPEAGRTHPADLSAFAPPLYHPPIVHIVV